VTGFWCEHAWVDGQALAGVRLTVTEGAFTEVVQAAAEVGDEQLRGVVLPGFANAHSHAFHRALRGRTGSGAGDFWSWRERMYAVAARLTPDTYLALARATYAEMAMAGVTAVGEFHYLHHQADGSPYDEPNVMAAALRQAARDAGIRLTLLDACYLQASVDGSPLAGPQRRFGDRDVDAWATRVAALRPDASTRVGVAAHSVRAVPRQAMRTIAAWDGPRHVHLSEQAAENAACRDAFGCSPTELLQAEGFLTARTTAVHATHVTGRDIGLLAAAGSGVCACATTERDLGDGLGPFHALHEAGVPLSVGSDQHAVIDLLEEARGIELHDRLAAQQRGRFRPAELVDALTARGQEAIGWGDAGRIQVGQRADLVAVRLDSVRTAGVDPQQLVLAATAADVSDVVVDGVRVVSDGRHRLGDVGRLLAAAIAAT
jgi:formiminoglutamate deiminase